MLPGTTYLLTRRCSERRYFLRPDRLTTQVLRYALAVAAARYRVSVHGFVVMSNHVHLLVTDNEAVLPAFMCWLDSITSRAMNRVLGRREAFWSTEDSYSRVEALDPEVALTQLIYVLVNPVRAGLVPRGSQWPGLWSDPERVEGRGYVAERPSVFFSASMPKAAELRLRRIPGFEELGAAGYRRLVRERLAEVEEEVRRERAEAGKGFAGRKRVLATKRSEAAVSAQERRRAPEVAATEEGVREAGERRYAEFRHDYDRALERFRCGGREVLFPAGTYKLRRELGVGTRGPPEKVA